MKKTKNILIIGSGTAGLLTALFCKHIFPNHNVKVIYNDIVGVIGVGESSTPHLPNFLKYLGINPIEAIISTKGTFKNGIKFQNWNGDGKSFFHSFGDKITDFSLDNFFTEESFNYYIWSLINNGYNLDEYVYQNQLARNNRIDLNNTHCAIHFDTNLLSKFLEEKSKEKGIDFIQGNFESAELDSNGFICNISLDNDRKYDCDFLFDCSGFSKIFSRKIYDIKWKSYSPYLAVKKAIPFWLEADTASVEPYTSAIAMKYGWVWKIPLQHRIGSGYIFDSDYIDEDKALEEAEILFGKKLKINKIINFEPGRYEKFWHKNFMSVGLASSFIEPLESTSLFMTITQLETFKYFVNDFYNHNTANINKFNTIIANNNDDVLNFIHLHYLTKRKDTDFWKNFTINYKKPDGLEEIYDKLKNGDLKQFDLSNKQTTGSFGLYNYLLVSNGLDLIQNKKNAVEYNLLNPTIPEYKKIIDEIYSQSMDHKEFLNNLSHGV